MIHHDKVATAEKPQSKSRRTLQKYGKKAVAATVVAGTLVGGLAANKLHHDGPPKTSIPIVQEMADRIKDAHCAYMFDEMTEEDCKKKALEYLYSDERNDEIGSAVQRAASQIVYAIDRGEIGEFTFHPDVSPINSDDKKATGWGDFEYLPDNDRLIKEIGLGAYRDYDGTIDETKGFRYIAIGIKGASSIYIKLEPSDDPTKGKIWKGDISPLTDDGHGVANDDFVFTANEAGIKTGNITRDEAYVTDQELVSALPHYTEALGIR